MTNRTGCSPDRALDLVTTWRSVCDCLAGRMQLQQITIIVADYDEAIAFFVDTLGFELVEDSPSLTNDGRPKRWVVVRPPGSTTALLLAQADGDVQRRAVGEQFAGQGRAVSARRRFPGHLCPVARAAACEFVTEPRDEPYGRVAVFRRHQSGNRWDLLGPPVAGGEVVAVLSQSSWKASARRGLEAAPVGPVPHRARLAAVRSADRRSPSTRVSPS